MSARAEILARVRAAIARGGAGPELPCGATPGDRSHLREPAARVREFRARLLAVGGRVEVVRDEQAAAQRFAQLVAELGLERIACSDSERLRGLRAAAPGVSWIEPRPTPHPPAERAPLFAACAGLSAVQLAVAESGTLLLSSSAERHRLVSLVPPVHVALLDARDIVADLGGALAHFAREGLPPTLSLITGPSRTADIELELVVGVHGPRELHVLLIDPESPVE